MVTAGQMPQLLGALDADGKYILPPSVAECLRSLLKKPTDTPNQIVPSAYMLYESVPRLDRKAFRYAVRDDKMFLMEGADSMGGLITDTVLTELGGFVTGENTTPDFTEIIKIKMAKARQRSRQLRENERIAARSLAAVRKIEKNTADEDTKKALTDANSEIAGVKRFVRLGKPDYRQAQMEILSRHSSGTELEPICQDYKSKIEAKDKKWAVAKLRLPGKVENAGGRTGVDAPETIGKIDPKRRTEFDAFYNEKAPRIAQYLLSEEEITDANAFAADKFVVVENPAPETDEIREKKKEEQEKQPAPQKKPAAQGAVSVQGQSTSQAGQPAPQGQPTAQTPPAPQPVPQVQPAPQGHISVQTQPAPQNQPPAPRVIYREVPLKMAVPKIETEGKEEV